MLDGKIISITFLGFSALLSLSRQSIKPSDLHIYTSNCPDQSTRDVLEIEIGNRRRTGSRIGHRIEQRRRLTEEWIHLAGRVATTAIVKPRRLG
ncbi:hypothetical protein F5Y03DRAFT_85571 [Xylaria venustula]|nr:hypothetical protein F5Y03DRAFT_85571 [Xylaria venustula]